LLQALYIPFDRINLLNRHAALDAAVNGAWFVLGEIVTGLGPHQDENLFQGIFKLGRRNGVGAGCPAKGQGAVGHKLGGHLGRRELKIHQAGAKGTARHAVVFRGFWILGHHHAAFGFDRPHAKGAIAAGAREHDANGPLALILGQGPEKEIDGHAVAPGVRGLQQMQGAIQEGHVSTRRNDVGAVGLHHHAIFHLEDLHAGIAPNQIGKKAFVIRGQMLHQHKGHARIDLGGHPREKGLKGPQAARRRADAHDGKWRRRLRLRLQRFRIFGGWWHNGGSGGGRLNLGRGFGSSRFLSGHHTPHVSLHHAPETLSGPDEIRAQW